MRVEMKKLNPTSNMPRYHWWVNVDQEEKTTVIRYWYYQLDNWYYQKEILEQTSISLLFSQ